MLGLALAIGLLAGAVSEARDPPQRTHCTMDHQRALDPRPRQAGPFRLVAIHCLWGGSMIHSGNEPIFSEDGGFVATFSDFTPQGQVEILRLGDRERHGRYDTGIGTFSRLSFRTDPVLAWSKDGRFLWTARQTVMRPGGGWAVTSAEPGPAQPGRQGGGSSAAGEWSRPPRWSAVGRA